MAVVPSLTRPELTLETLAAGDQPTLAVPAVGAVLRPWRPNDASAVRAVYADPAIRRWHARTLDSDDEARELVERWRAGWSQSREASWALVDGSDAVLGRVAVKVADPDGVGELAYWTTPAARGRGMCPTAVDVASSWAFDVGFHRLQLVHSVENAASCRAAQKAGFEPEGVRRESVLHDDGWHDMHVHARIAGRS
jgi:[ribosomal protein S5]-alanine N-acetyltransferase